MTHQTAFERLRPLCVDITKTRSIRAIKTLQEELRSVDDAEIQRFQEYIIFPLTYILKLQQRPSQETCEAGIHCITDVINITKVTNWEMFADLFTQVTVLVSSPVKYGQVNDFSEELKLAVVMCLQSLVKRSSPSVISCIYKDNFLAPLGHCISILLSLAEHEKMRELRVQAIQCLLILADDEEMAVTRAVVSETFASFLPGIAMSLCRVITGDPKQGQSVIISALNAWAKMVAMVMSDLSFDWSSLSNPKASVQPSQENNSGRYLLPPHRVESEKDTKHSLDQHGRELRVVRNSDWLKNTSKKLKILVEKIVPLRSNPSWKIRLAMVDCVERLLLDCTRSLTESVPMMLEVLVGLVNDEYTEIATASQKALDKFSSVHLQHDSKTVVEILEENLHSLMTSLPRLMRTTGDSQKLATLNLVHGYLKLLGNKLNTMLHSVSHLKRLSVALIQVLELDTSDVKIVEEKTSTTGIASLASASVPSSANSTPGIPGQLYLRRQKYFKHFRDEKIYQVLVQICRLLGRHGHLQLLIDTFMDKFRSSDCQRKQAILIISEILEGFASRKDLKTEEDFVKIDKEAIVRSLLYEYISPPYWHLVTSNQSEFISSRKSVSDRLVISDQEKDTLTLGTLNSNVLQICLLLESIGTFAKVLGSDFNVLLIESLYPVMEKLGDETAVISETAYGTLIDICQNCSYKSIEQLICENSDYLVDAISHNLRHLDLYPKAPDVLKVMLQYGNIDVLPLTRDIIDEILDTLDQCYDEKAASFMKVLHELVCSVKRWYPPEQNKMDEFEANKDKSLSSSFRTLSKNKQQVSESVKEFVEEYQKQKKIAKGEEVVEEVEEIEESKDAGDTADSQDVELDEVDKKPELPMHVQVVMQVLERCMHFVSSKNPRLRLLVLEIIKNSVIVLQTREDELLPMVHKLWPSMVHRFMDEEQLVTIKAFETLCVMGVVCGDFIRRRVVKDVWPNVIKFLDKQAVVSSRSGPAYKHTISYKQQLAVLNGIGQLSVKLDIGENECLDIASVCLPYLSARQPDTLQQAAVSTFQNLKAIEPDLIWLLLSDTYTATPEMDPPSSEFPQIKFAGTQSEASQYAKNVGYLLQES
ncbi:TELO2-interacting protein 1 homolog isoform X2 [Ptychodera flava]|uniref:TELO2-interacting protein 1 homolog isoform X2 n=1 Tax=Ptychodera flava TaxID=63121 RepID=UPI00396A1261